MGDGEWVAQVPSEWASAKAVVWEEGAGGKHRATSYRGVTQLVLPGRNVPDSVSYGGWVQHLCSKVQKHGGDEPGPREPTSALAFTVAGTQPLASADLGVPDEGTAAPNCQWMCLILKLAQCSHHLVLLSPTQDWVAAVGRESVTC